MEPEHGQNEQEGIVQPEQGNLDSGQRHRRALFVGGVIVLASALFTEIPLARAGYAHAAAGYGVATILWITLLRRSRLRSWEPELPIILLVAVVLRIPFLFADPLLSGDVHRYRWDGEVFASGRDPYAYAPNAPELSDLREGWHVSINHPEVPTIYPPLAQELFLVWGITGAGLWLWRLLLITVDLAIIGLSGRRLALFWATCPLVILEGIWSSHIEIVVAGLLLAAWWAVVRKRSVAGGLLLSAASGLKLTPIAATPSLIHASPSRARASVAFLAGLAIPFLPFVGGPLMRGFGEYAVRWEFNGVVYEPIKWLVLVTSLDARMKSAFTSLKNYLPLESFAPAVYAHLYPSWIARALCVVPLVLMLAYAWRRPRFSGRIAWSVAALLLASPTLHPWYWLPVIPLAVISSELLLLSFALASPLSYVWYVDAAASEGTSLLLCYALPAAVCFLLRKRRLEWRILTGEGVAESTAATVADDRKPSDVSDV